MPVNSLMGPDNSSIPLDNHQDPCAGSYNNNYGHDNTFDAYGQDYYAGSGCHGGPAATEISAPSSFYDILPPPSSPSHALNENSPLDTSPSYRQLVSPRELQEVFDDLTRRPTDPVGKVGFLFTQTTLALALLNPFSALLLLASHCSF